MSPRERILARRADLIAAALAAAALGCERKSDAMVAPSDKSVTPTTKATVAEADAGAADAWPVPCLSIAIQPDSGPAGSLSAARPPDAAPKVCLSYPPDDPLHGQ